METATRNLENDHVHILKLTDVMKAMTHSESPDVDHVESVIDIIKNFADGLHHGKEEEILFPALENKGFSAQQGPVAVMLHEHELGRNFVRGMSESLESLRKGNTDARDKLNMNLSGYADLLFNHISKENNILFRMADKVLSAGEQKDLLDHFHTVEDNRGKGSRAEDYIMRINDLARIYEV